MGAGRHGAPVARALDAATGALRWVAGAAVNGRDGARWPVTRAPGSPLADDLYDGTAGILRGFTEARLCGLGEFDEPARAAARRLESLGRSWPGPRTAGPAEDADPGLYTGLAGAVAALRGWALASGDRHLDESARAIAETLARVASRSPPPGGCPDIISGDAGILVTLAGLGGPAALGAVSVITSRLVARATWDGDGPDWYVRDGYPYLMPNFSHGAAGVGFALATAGRALGRPGPVEVAESAGRRLAVLGRRPDGTIAVPNRIPPDPRRPVSYGWCHGPTGTMRLFQLLDQLRPGRGWDEMARACRLAVRHSGLPERLYPGFWDNLGQCCGTAGVGEMALDTYQETGDASWLDWAWALAGDLLARRVEDGAGVRWSHTEHRLDPPELEPATGWMQGAAGIAGFLLRLARVEREGAGATRAWWPDRPSLPGAPLPGVPLPGAE